MSVSTARLGVGGSDGLIDADPSLLTLRAEGGPRMRKRVALIVAAMSISTLALASQPGQPLDCSDWVFLEPGLRCETLVPFPCITAPSLNPGPECYAGTNARAIDNTGALLRLVQPDSSRTVCGSSFTNRNEIWEFRGETQRLLAYLDERCVTSSPLRMDLLGLEGLNAGDHSYGVVFDPISGRLIFGANPLCVGCPPSEDYRGGTLLAISGFATLHEVATTYSTEQAVFEFRAPVQPLGFAGVDHFDTYWGALTQPLDLSNAHPLQCAYSSTPTNPGDYLTIDVPVPNPAPGEANYVLTSVTYQGQTRAGRKASGGRLTGRDASRLPACVQE